VVLIGNVHQGPMRIALVDPSPAIDSLAACSLDTRGHEVLWFADGMQALHAIKADPLVDTLITDSDTGPLSGVELCWEARLLAGKKRPIYILLVAPPEDQRTWTEGLDCGADDVIAKPPAMEELFAKLRVADRVVTLQRELIAMATRDPLTGVYNRRAFFEEATEACGEARCGSPLSVLLLDIDRFKAINDHYGHDVGDQAIRAVAQEAARGGGIVGRLGGDEFSILLRGAALPRAAEVAETLRQRLSRMGLSSREGLLNLTCSLGASEYEPGDSIDDLMKRADLALYRAKEAGRNRVATPPTGPWLNEKPRQAVSLVRSISRKPASGSKRNERRKGEPPSDSLLARICAVIDLLVASGMSEEGAAQVMTRRMIAVGVSAPKKGHAPTGWKRLLAWKAELQDGLSAQGALDEYRDFAAQIDRIPPQERVERVLEDELWNRRRRPRPQPAGTSSTTKV
jgi:diguanylate cyclase (GGDEF)-like protein